MEIKKMILNKISTVLLSLMLTFSFAFAQDEISTDEAVIKKGEELFSNNCTQCHGIGAGVVVGPDLKDVHTRRPVAWIKSFILNSQKVIGSGDAYAVALYEKFNKTQMNSHDFNDEQLNSVIAYIKFTSENAALPAPTEAAGGTTTAATVVKEGDNTLNQVLMILVVLVLVVLLITLLVINKVVANMASKRPDLSEEDRELLEQKFEISYLWKAPWIRGLVVVVLLLWGGSKALDFVMGIGIQQGYAPTQPIAFSHKIHAGAAADGGHEIDCNYCHTGVRKSKSANIPSANICMNCHREIKKDSPEIKKIYAAVESGKPIEWVRIHNLPDLAYFNHSQHVKVGNVECQKCHGPVETMDVVAQQEDLTMGWCVNCHRETAVNAEGNAYYDKLLELHKNKTKKPMTVENIGGLECAKCHY